MQGTLFLVVGSRGTGKGDILQAARRLLADDHRFRFPRRLITLPRSLGAEVHQAVTPAQFDRLRRLGAFALCWTAHGINYAIPASVEQDLADGRSVVVNVSPTIVAAARAKYPRTLVVELRAAERDRADRLARRLADRPPESEDYGAAMRPDRIISIPLGGSLDEAAARLVDLLDSEHGALPLPLLRGEPRRPAGVSPEP